MRDPIYGKSIQPTTHRYPTRARALTMLLYGKPAPPTPPPGELPAYFLNAIINEETGEVRADALQLNAVIDPTTGEKREYRHLTTDPITRKNWDPAMIAELGRLTQGTRNGEKGTDTIKFIRPSAIPHGKKATYIRIVVDIRPNK